MKLAVRYYSKTGRTKEIAKVVSDIAEVPYLDITQKLDKNVDILFLVSSMFGITSKKVKKFIEDIDVKVDDIILIGPKIVNKCLKKELECNGFDCDTREYILNPIKTNKKTCEEVTTFTKKILGKK